LCEAFGFADGRLEILPEMLPVLVARGELERARTVAQEFIATLAAVPGAVPMPVDAADARERTPHSDGIGRLLIRRLGRSLDAQTLRSSHEDEEPRGSHVRRSNLARCVALERDRMARLGRTHRDQEVSVFRDFADRSAFIAVHRDDAGRE
jgi:hypothetical protein